MKSKNPARLKYRARVRFKYSNVCGMYKCGWRWWFAGISLGITREFESEGEESRSWLQI